MTPLDAAWRCIADACCEGDVEHERRALAELARLTQRSGDAVEHVAAQAGWD